MLDVQKVESCKFEQVCGSAPVTTEEATATEPGSTSTRFLGTIAAGLLIQTLNPKP